MKSGCFGGESLTALILNVVVPCVQIAIKRLCVG
jgi:hypothetical protein